MKSLEIKVNDEVEVFDTLVDAINYITEAVKRWYDSEDERPFSISLERKDGRAPPLRINVNDGVGARSGLV